MRRYYFDRKVTTEECLNLSTFFLKKHDYFKGGLRQGVIETLRGDEIIDRIGVSVRAEAKFVGVIYRLTNQQTGKIEDKNYKISLETTPCNYGGLRYWFKCPRCFTKVAILYLHNNDVFNCRHCLNLSYQSRNESKRFQSISYIFGHDTISEQIANLKTKYYKGKPTKKYLQLLKKSDYLSKKLRISSFYKELMHEELQDLYSA